MAGQPRKKQSAQAIVSRPRLGTTRSPGSLREVQRSPISVEESNRVRTLRPVRSISEPGFVRVARSRMRRG
jgi:hypothetical protein